LNNVCIGETKSPKALSQNETKSTKTIKHEILGWQSTTLSDNYDSHRTPLSL